jgi:short-subunit dehydrogenase
VERLWNTATPGITVTALMPGPTDTEFLERAGMEDTRVGPGQEG